jgi:hypothetical protein
MVELHIVIQKPDRGSEGEKCKTAARIELKNMKNYDVNMIFMPIYRLTIFPPPTPYTHQNVNDL